MPNHEAIGCKVIGCTKCKDIKVFSDFDAAKWAKEFWNHFGTRKDQIDEELMHVWFANSIMSGYDHALNKKEEI